MIKKDWNAKIIALDLDGTLLDSEKHLSARNRAALEACIQKGIYVVPTTGRPAAGIMQEILSIKGIRYAITVNGGVIADLAEKRCLKRCIIPNGRALALLKRLGKYHVMYDPYMDGKGISQPDFIEHMDDYKIPETIQRLVRATRSVVPDILEYVEQCGSDVEKINVFLADMGEMVPLRQELSAFEDMVISSSMVNNLEINALGATKGEALLWLADFLGVPCEDTIAFGDGENDISMLRAAGIGIAMANASDIVKEAADQLTGTNDKDGVACAIEQMILERD